jgi:c(7)-type cytochrome triheme protein
MKKLIVLFAAAVMTLAVANLSFALKKDVEFKAVKDEGKVTFSHENHTEKKGLKCAECHPKVFKMKAGGDTVTMADIKAGKFCGTCHDGKKAFDATAADSCPKCHKK